jgi:hypothetical protein
MKTRTPIVVALAVMTAACMRTPTTPSVGTLAYVPGPAPTVFTGSMQDSVGGNGSITVLLATASGLTSGTWIMAFGTRGEPTRFISGSISGTSYTAEVSQCLYDPNVGGVACIPNCRMSFQATLTSTTLSGSYAEEPGDSCGTPRSGTVNAVKQ